MRVYTTVLFSLGLDGDTHVAAGALNDTASTGKVNGIEIGHLDVGDLFQLGLSDRANLLPGRVTGPGLDTSGLLDELRARRGLEDEGEGTVFEHGDLDGDNLANLLLGGGIVLLAETHDVDTLRTIGHTHTYTRGWGGEERVALGGESPQNVRPKNPR